MKARLREACNRHGVRSGKKDLRTQQIAMTPNDGHCAFSTMPTYSRTTDAFDAVFSVC